MIEPPKFLPKEGKAYWLKYQHLITHQNQELWEMLCSSYAGFRMAQKEIKAERYQPMTTGDGKKLKPAVEDERKAIDKFTELWNVLMPKADDQGDVDVMADLETNLEDETYDD